MLWRLAAATGGVVNVTRRVPTEKFTSVLTSVVALWATSTRVRNVPGKITSMVCTSTLVFPLECALWRSTNDKNRSLFAALAIRRGFAATSSRASSKVVMIYGTDTGLPRYGGCMYRGVMISSTQEG